MEQPQRRVPAAPAMKGQGSVWVAMTSLLARVVRPTPSYSGHVCTLFHCLLAYTECEGVFSWSLLG